MIPLIANALPVTVTIDTAKSADPVLLKTRFEVLFNPVDTVPQLMEAGATDNCGCDVPLTAVADRFATTGELPPSPATVSVPVIAPAAVGFTATVIVPDCPTASAMGKFMPDRLNWELEKVA